VRLVAAEEQKLSSRQDLGRPARAEFDFAFQAMDSDFASYLVSGDLLARWEYETNHFELLRFHERRRDRLRDCIAQWADVDDLTG
jgi:hypothetical protein